MSISVMTSIWKTCLFNGNTLTVMLAMGDFADDQGNDIFPGIELLAAKVRASVRTTQVALRFLEELRVIEQVANSAGGRAKVTEYRIDLERVQVLQGLHEAEAPDCEHCQAKRRSAEKRAQFRAQRVQGRAAKGADAGQKGAESRSRSIEDIHQEPSEIRHTDAPADAGGESRSVTRLGKAESESWPEFRSMVAAEWPGGFPADDEHACRQQFERLTRLHGAELLIACARLHGQALTKRQAARPAAAGPGLFKRPSNWLGRGDWGGYRAAALEWQARQAKIDEVTRQVQRELGTDLVEQLRAAGFADAHFACLEGFTLERGENPVILVTSNAARVILENRWQALHRVFGERIRVQVVPAAKRA